MFRVGNKRPLKFAGSWYEADPKKLAVQIDGYNEAARPKTLALEKDLTGQEVLAIVAPHAGYTFSGPTAACSYQPPLGKKIKRVFLLGPSHYKGFSGAAVTADKSFATVFGDLQVDTDTVNQLKHDHEFQELSEVHRNEHSLEMQLAFIKKDLGDVKIVPILIGRLDDASDARYLAAQIKSHLHDGDLIVVSSDFTHYGPRYGYTPFGVKIDGNVKKLDMEAFSYLKKNDLEGFFAFYQRTEDTICGVYGLAVLLALLPEDAVGHLIDYRTSRDSVVEDDSNSVSYLAIVFSAAHGWNVHKESSQNLDGLTEDDKQSLLRLARGTLEHYVSGGKAPDFGTVSAAGHINLNAQLKRPQGVFVTLFRLLPENLKGKRGINTTSGARDGKELRGCIGYIMPVKPLYQAVMENTMSACSKDLRFEPVEPGELKDIEIEISVLTVPKKVASYKDIRVGTDGVLLYCQGRQSVFLPHVATEFGWDLDETLSQLAHKAGLPRLAWQSPGARFEVFQAISMEEKRH